MINIIRKILKLFNIPATINRSFDGSVCIEYWFLDDRNRKLSIDLIPLFPISNFVLYRKLKGECMLYKYIEIDLPWIYIYYMY